MNYGKVDGIASKPSEGGNDPEWAGTVEGVFSNIKAQLETGGEAFSGLSTGFFDLDTRLQGLRPGDLIVVAGRPDMGKTSFVMNIAECVALGRPIASGTNPRNKPQPVLFFSPAMDADSFASRMLYGRAGLSRWRLQHGLLNKAEREDAARRLAVAHDELKTAPIRLVTGNRHDIREFAATARALKEFQGLGLVVVDSLSLYDDGRIVEDAGPWRVFDRYVRELKGLARDLQVPVIIVTQDGNREQGISTTVRPTLADLRETGILPFADVVLLLHRPCRTKDDPESDKANLVIVDVAKNHDDATGEVRLDFQGDLHRFGNRDRQEDSAPGPVPSRVK